MISCSKLHVILEVCVRKFFSPFLTLTKKKKRINKEKRTIHPKATIFPIIMINVPSQVITPVHVNLTFMIF